jgi:hydrogenase expression/formation protein HypE
MTTAPVRAVLFDFDGTLTAPGGLDFARIRAALGCPDNETILEFISSLPTPEAQADAHRALERFEEEAAAGALPNRDAEQVLAFLKSRGFPFGIITRNRHSMVLLSLRSFPGVSINDFRVILTRDDLIAPKPAPDGIIAAARQMGVRVEQLMVVGDFRYDIEAGQRAGAVTVLLENEPDQGDPGCVPTYRIAGLGELPGLIARLADGVS